MENGQWKMMVQILADLFDLELLFSSVGEELEIAAAAFSRGNIGMIDAVAAIPVPCSLFPAPCSLVNPAN